MKWAGNELLNVAWDFLLLFVALFLVFACVLCAAIANWWLFGVFAMLTVASVVIPAFLKKPDLFS